MTQPARRPTLWQEISATLRAEIAAGHYGAGDKLPTEAALGTRFGVNRHTVRRALADLAQDGTLHARRGAGVFVAAAPTDYALGRRVRFHQNIAASGQAPSRRLTRLETRPCDLAEAEALHLKPGEAVHLIEGVSLADGQPLAVFRSVFPAERLPDLLGHMDASHSVTAALAACGVPDYARVSTKITAKLATAQMANALHIAIGAPVLRSVAINADPSGQVVEYGTTWFAGDRVTLTVTPDPA